MKQFWSLWHHQWRRNDTVKFELYIQVQVRVALGAGSKANFLEMNENIVNIFLGYTYIEAMPVLIRND